MLRKPLLGVGVSILLALICGPVLLGQVTTATILGTIKDDTGAVLPGVSVTVKQLDTGRVRNVITDDEGRYRAPELDLGDYEVQTELTGFQTTVRRGITLTLGREAVVDIVLKVGELSEKVVVQGEAALVETTSATVAGLVDDKKIRDLPLNGRGFTQLALLQEGVSSPGGQGTQPGNEGQKLSVGGTRTTQTAFLIDGTDVRNQWGGTPGSAAGVVLGVETVREFTVITSTASAEYGGFTGGVVNAVTRSGTNQLHGSLFEFMRNSALDARNFFDGKTPPAFKRNQFGFTLGGPIRRDRTFFFGSYEGLRDRLTTTTIRTVPDSDAHRGILPARLGGNVGVHPAVKPFLDLYPLPNGRIFGDGTGELIFGHPQPANENYYTLKIDHQLGLSDSLFIRYTADKGVRSNLSTLPQWTESVLNLNQYITIDERKIFSAKLINQFLFALNRNQAHGEISSDVDPKLKFIPTPDRTWGNITIPNVASWGPFGVVRQSNALNRFEYGDTVVYTTGRHAIKVGFRFTRHHLNTVNPFRSFGMYNFDTLALFLQNRPTLFFGVVTPLIRQGLRQNMVGTYVQDDFKLRPNLSLNLGLRYEFITNPVEVAGRISNLDGNVSVGATLRVGNPWMPQNPSLKSFAPRFGFAWDPFSDGKMSVRGGFGVFYDLIGPPIYQGAPQVNPPFFIQANVVSPVFPNVYSTLGDLTAVRPNIWVIPDPKQSYVMQYNLTAQREILPSTVVTVGYFGSRGVHLNRFTDANIAPTNQRVDGRVFFPADSQRRNPAFGQLRVFLFEANSFYNAVRFGLNRRFHNGFQLQSSYSYSRSIDDASNTTPIDSTSSPNGVSNMPDDHKYDRGLSGFDVRHVYVANVTYELPFGPKQRWGANWRAVPSKLFGGWQVNSIVNLTTGLPLNIRNGFERSRSRAGTDLSERPDLRPGASNNPVLSGGRDPNRYYDPNSFVLQPAGFFGNLGRNTVIRPGVATVDFGLVKDSPFGEERMVQFRAEFFNILNRANFGSPNGVAFSNALGTPAATAGRITSTTTTSRQIQFALKMIF